MCDTKFSEVSFLLKFTIWNDDSAEGWECLAVVGELSACATENVGGSDGAKGESAAECQRGGAPAKRPSR